MEIVSAEWVSDIYKTAKVVYADGSILFVPLDPANSDYQALLASGVPIADYVPRPPPAPTTITLAQARRQLRTLNLFTTVDNAASTDQTSAAYDAWNYGNGVTRGQALATFIQTTLAWTDAQMDEFMTAAAAIEL